MEKKNLAVIASRLKCVDAVSIEAEKWIDKYVKLGYNVHLCTGKFGEPVDLPHLELPVMDYKHPEVRGVKSIMFSAKLEKEGKKAAEILLNNLVKRIKGPLKDYLIKNKIDILCIEDSLSSMKNLPLNIALSQIVSESGLPTINRVHYLPWENPYFMRFDNFPKLIESIPPLHKNIVHITNTASAKEKLAEKKKISSKLIPNTLDLDKLQKLDDYNRDFRKALGIRDDQLIFLQPTRVKRNKYVERSIKLVAEINDIMKKDNVLLVTGSPVYSRGNYFEEIIKKMDKQNVQVIFANDKVFLGRHENPDRKFYSIGDAYVHADIVLYPNTGDAFGNPIIEAAAYKKPLIVNSFPNLKEFTDKGFEFVVMDNKITPEVISETYRMVSDEKIRTSAADHNFALLGKYYSSDTLDDSLMPILNDFDQQKSFMSKFAGQVAGFIPGRFWKKQQPPKPKHQKDYRKKYPAKRSNKPNNHVKKKNFKGSVPNKDNKIKGPALKNKKGGYKEPVNQDVQEEKR